MSLRCCRLLAIALFLLAAASLRAQDNMVLGMHQVTLAAREHYLHPHRDVTVRCTFTGPDGQSYEVTGFWDGGDTWRVRFAPPKEGIWSWRASATNQRDSGLNGVAGSFVVQPYTGDDPFRLHGWPRVSGDGRYLTYADGTPYFYLGDTAWEIVWKSTREQVERYLLDRKVKGFNAMQVVASSHFFLPEYGIENRDGQRFFLDTALTLPNPRYYDYLDTIVARANALGIMVVIVPLWGGMCDVSENHLYHQRPLSADKLYSLYRYIGARYAGSNVLWVVAADDFYDTPEEVEVRGQSGRILKLAGGASHLCTIHPAGWSSSFYFFPDSAAWLDFNAYQPSHRIDAYYVWSAPAEALERGVTKPLLNMECNYEDLYDHLWQTTEPPPPPPRIAPVDVRQGAYQALLAGALVGSSYGCNGVWQWSQEWDMGYQYPRDVADIALHYPGSAQMGVLKQLMERIEWYRLRPRQDLVVHYQNPVRDHLAVAELPNMLVCYVPARSESFSIDLSRFIPVAVLQWVDPKNGRVMRYDTVSDGGSFSSTFVPLDTNDWLVFASRPNSAPINGVAPVDKSTMHFFSVVPNPSTGSAAVLLDPAGSSGRVAVRVVDAIGRVVAEDEVVVAQGQQRVPIPRLPVGVYTVRLHRLDGAGGESWSGRVVVQ